MSGKKASTDPELVIRVAELIAQGKGYSEVATDLSISSRKVEPLVEAAMTQFLKTRARLTELEEMQKPQPEIAKDLLSKYKHLKHVHIEPKTPVKTKLHYEALVKRWAFEAARYFDQIVRSRRNEKLHVCMSGGETILEIANSLEDRDRPNVHYYASASIGRAMRFASAHVDPIATTNLAWSRSGRFAGQCNYATVSPYNLKSESPRKKRERVQNELAKLLMDGPLSQHYEHMFDEIEIAFAGVGVVHVPETALDWQEKLTATTLLTHLGISPEEIAVEGAVGEIGYSYFDRDGKGRDDWHFTPTAGDHSLKLRGPNFYKHLVRRGKDVIVAAGVGKHAALIPALKAEMFNVWFTDEPTVMAALEAE